MRSPSLTPELVRTPFHLHPEFEIPFGGSKEALEFHLINFRFVEQSLTDPARSELFEGGYYSIIDGETFSVARVLKLDPEIVHVRIYKQKFKQRPRSIDPGQLTLGTIHDTDGFGMGHLPLRLNNFMNSEPQFLTHRPIEDGELEGYRTWKDAGGGVWG